jgi:hypothetical protein
MRVEVLGAGAAGKSRLMKEDRATRTVNGAGRPTGLAVVWFVALFIVLGVAVGIRIALSDMPLERDEGEYAYAGQLLLRGIPPYQLAYNMKFPGTYAAYALIMSIFGQSIAGIHLGLLVVNLATVLLIFLIGRRLINSTAGIAAAASYAILSVCRSVLGAAGHATHFVVLPMLAGTLLLLRPSHLLSKKILLLSGVFFGLALLMKQPALFFIPFGAGYLFFRDWREQLSWKKILLRNALFLGGAALPFVMTCLLFWRAGVFTKFWFWTVTYARVYGGIVSASEAVQIFFEEIRSVIDSAWPLWTLAVLGLAACWWNKNVRSHAIFFLSFLAFSALALCPGFYFREHYFVMIFPAISLLAGAAIAAAEDFCVQAPSPFRFLPLLVFMAASILPLLAQKPFVTAPGPTTASRKIYGLSPFPAAVRIARYLQEHTKPEDKIAVLGSEPEIYFYAHRLSATGYIYMYGLTEPHKYALQMQREMIQEIEAARPKYLVYVKEDYSWLERENSEKLIFNWVRKYSAENFMLVGLVDIASEKIDYYFPPPEKPASIRSSRYLLIYERKP